MHGETGERVVVGRRMAGGVLNGGRTTRVAFREPGTRVTAGPARSPRGAGLIMLALVLLTGAARADERMFGYVYEADVLPRGAREFEQWVTARAGKESGRYARWDFREELEYGLTERLTTAVYLNFTDEYEAHAEPEATGAPDAEAEEDGEERAAGGLDFTGVSSEWKYQLLSPYRDPIGVLAYLEVGSDLAGETEVEEKLVLSKNWEKWLVAANVVVEQEWEYEDGETEEEGKLELTAGVSRKVSNHWSGGLEVRNQRVYPGSFAFEGEAASATFLGPNVAYGNAGKWATLSVLPQIYGDGEHAEDNLELDEYTRIEIRLLAGITL